MRPTASQLLSLAAMTALACTTEVVTSGTRVCGSDAACLEDEICIDHQCVRRCANDGECPTDEQCCDGLCFATCTSCFEHETLCTDNCVDLSSSHTHCGDCDTSCPTLYGPRSDTCIAGECTCAASILCSVAERCASSGCVSICTPAICPDGCCAADGSCQPVSQRTCGTGGIYCVDCLTNTGADICSVGACVCQNEGAPCAPGQVCDGGDCVAAPFTCGDGEVLAPEECDDRNQTDGDGCDHECHVEADYTCIGEPSTCQICVEHHHSECVEDRYRYSYDSCGQRHELLEDCGVSEIVLDCAEDVPIEVDFQRGCTDGICFETFETTPLGDECGCRCADGDCHNDCACTFTAAWLFRTAANKCNVHQSCNGELTSWSQDTRSSCGNWCETRTRHSGPAVCQWESFYPKCSLVFTGGVVSEWPGVIVEARKMTCSTP